MHSFFISEHIYKREGRQKVLSHQVAESLGCWCQDCSFSLSPSLSSTQSTAVVSLCLTAILSRSQVQNIFFSWAAAVSGWFFGQLRGWLTDTIVNHARSCETHFWNHLRVKLPVNCLGCFVFQDGLFGGLGFFCFLSPI